MHVCMCACVHVGDEGVYVCVKMYMQEGVLSVSVGVCVWESACMCVWEGACVCQFGKEESCERKRKKI